MVQKVTRVKTNQCEIISSLIGQYTENMAKYEQAKKDSVVTLIWWGPVSDTNALTHTHACQSLDVSLHLYKKVCPSVGLSVCALRACALIAQMMHRVAWMGLGFFSIIRSLKLFHFNDIQISESLKNLVLVRFTMEMQSCSNYLITKEQNDFNTFIFYTRQIKLVRSLPSYLNLVLTLFLIEWQIKPAT